MNSSSVNCICATNPNCQSLVAIYSNDEFTDDGRGPDPVYIVPGAVTSCFVINSLMLSTLECFYSNSDCMSIIRSYIEEAYHRVTDYPQPIDVRLLVYDSTSSRFVPRATIGLIIREIMIEKWNPSTFYSHYYELCAPINCAYSDARYANSGIEIIILLISTIGGLCTTLKLITPNIVHTISHFWRWLHVTRHHRGQRQQTRPISN